VQTFGNKFCANIFCSSIDDLECTPTDRQIYPWGYMYARLGNLVLNHCRRVLGCKFRFSEQIFLNIAKWSKIQKIIENLRYTAVVHFSKTLILVKRKEVTLPVKICLIRLIRK